MKRPETFEEAFDAYLFHCTNWGMASEEYGRQWRSEHPGGWGTTKEDRQAYFHVMLAFAVKEAKVPPLVAAAVVQELDQ